MKKAVIIGGSNGIGLALSLKLIERGYHAEILDIAEPDKSEIGGGYTYTRCDLRALDEELIKSFAGDDGVEVLMVTAGVGRMAEFEHFHTAEIDKIMTIDAVSALKIFSLFYGRINSGAAFYSGVMGSIAGWMSTPCGAVYSAAKGSVSRFTESVNIELEMKGRENRILNVSPSSFKGSGFYGGKNDLSLLEPLADEITEKLFERETLFIPQYEEIFKGVLERYHNDPHEYGIHSYKYKMDSGRIDNSRKVKIGYLSGTFDLFHIGHLNLLRRAKERCDYLIVGVHDSGKWKGKETFISLEERKAIVGACRYVDRVVDSCREDSDAWDLYHYDRLFVGSDYKGTERFNRYEEYFKDKGVEIVYFSYTQSTSSSQLRDAISKKS